MYQCLQIRLQAVLRKVFFPEPWCRFFNSGGVVRIDSLQDIDQVVIRIYLVQPAGHQQTLNNAPTQSRVPSSWRERQRQSLLTDRDRECQRAGAL